MKLKSLGFVAVAAGLLSLCLGTGTSLASILAGFEVTGTITSVSGISSVTIDGHLYIVRATSPAAQQLPQFTPGQVVDIYLDGPPTTSASQVIAINAHSDTTGQ